MNRNIAITIATLTLMLYGCSAQWHLKQAIRKDPAIQQTVVVKKDTVIVTKERTIRDTLELFKDTTIYQDRIKLKIEYIDNFVNVEADCPSDTIVVTKSITTTELKKSASIKERVFDALALLVIGGALVLLVRYLARVFIIN